MSQRSGQEFLEKTKYKYLHVSDQMRGLSPPPLEAGFDKKGKQISLPGPHDTRICTSVPRRLVAAVGKR